MITAVSLVSVWVTDLDESRTFTTDVLGFEVGDADPLAGDEMNQRPSIEQRVGRASHD